MSSGPYWHEVKKMDAYKYARQEVDSMIKEALRPLAARLSLLEQACSELLAEAKQARDALAAEATRKGPLDDLPTQQLPIRDSGAA